MAKLNAAQEARRLFDQFKQQAGGAVKQAVRTVANQPVSGIPFSPTIGQAVKAVQQVPQRQLATAKLIGNYAQNQVINPIKQGVPQVQKAYTSNSKLGFLDPRNAINAVPGALQTAGGVLNATPGGMAYNLGNAVLTEGAKAVRNRALPTEQSFGKSFSQPTSFAQEGLNIKGHPILAGGIDLVTGRSPKALLKDPTGYKAVGNIVNSVKNLAKSHKSNILRSPDSLDLPNLDQTVAVLLDPNKYKKFHPNEITTARLDLQKLLDTYIRERTPAKNYEKLLKASVKDQVNVLQSFFRNADKPKPQISSGTYTMGDNFTPNRLGIVGTNQTKPNVASAELSVTTPPISAEAVVRKGQIKATRMPTQTEIRNNAEIAAGKPDLYTQRQMKLQQAGLTKGNPELLPSEPNIQQTAQVLDNQPKTRETPPVAPQPQQSYSGGLNSVEKALSQEAPQGQHSIPQAQSSETLVKSITDKPGLSTDDKTAFADWVNSRRAVETEKFVTKQDYKDLDTLGTDAFHAIQKGDTEGRFKTVREFLNKKYNQANVDAGIGLNYQKDYLPQVWDNTPEQIAQVFGKRVTTKPGFTLEKVIDDYATGIAAGLKPKFTKLSDLLGDYEGRVNKAVADRSFFNYLNNNKLILSMNEKPEGWRVINPDRFPKIKTRVNGIEVTQEGPFFAPKELAEKINNYLYNPAEDGSKGARTLSAIADYVSRVKNITLSFGFPGTAINSHGVNILARHTIFGQGGNMITRFAKGANYMVNQYSSGKNIQKISPELPSAIKKGLTIGTEERKSIMEGAGLRGKFGEAWSKTFEVALFDKMLPSLKYDSYKALVKDFSKTMPPAQAQREAARIANNIYGGINWEQLGRDRNLQNFFRATILAPDWAETTVKLGGNFAKAFTNNSPQAQKYRNMVASFVTAYIGANIANKLSSGHFMFENESGHTFEIEAGTTEDGQTRFFRPFGTGMDMYRLPYDMVLSFAKGDVSSPVRMVRNRLSIPAGVAVGAITDTDYRGRAIGYRGTDKYGQKIPLGQRAVNLGGEALSLTGFPNFLREGAKTATGQQGLEQGIAQGGELPLRYSQGGSSLQKYRDAEDATSQKRSAAVANLSDTLLDPNTDKEKKIKIVQALQANPKVFSQVKQELKDRQLNVTQYDKAVRNLSSQQRAKFIIDEVKSKKSKEEKKQLILEYQSKGILTDSVVKEMRLVLTK